MLAAAWHARQRCWVLLTADAAPLRAAFPESGSPFPEGNEAVRPPTAAT
jgi:hypothetical protein